MPRLNSRKRAIPKPDDTAVSLRVKDYGPISDADVVLRPFTIFVGPNNSGKSYLAILLHSVFQAVRDSTSRFFIWRAAVDLDQETRGPRYVLEFHPHILETSILNDLRSYVRGLEPDDTQNTIPPDLVNRTYHALLRRVFQHALGQQIAESQVCLLPELVRIGTKTFGMRIASDGFSAEIAYSRTNSGLQLKHVPDFEETVVVPGTGKDADGSVIDQIIGDLTKKLIEGIRGHLNHRCLYLPAARSGILQAFRVISSSILLETRKIGLGPMRSPGLSGVALGFMSSLMVLPDKLGHYSGLATEWEKELIGGSVTLPSREGGAYSDINYKFKGKTIPVHRASSTVTELAPLLLFLKYYLTPGDVLIFEEPEAHLHPANQRNLARLLVRMRRNGLRLLITTHSQYMLEQLSHFVLLEQVPADRRKAMGYDESDFLEPEELGVYLFQYDRKTKGFKTKEIPIDPEEGIGEEGFASVHESLYDEAVRLARYFADKHSHESR